MISVEDALARILEVAKPLGIEQVLLGDAVGRTLGETVISGRGLPPWDNSSMDGYAVRASEVEVNVPLPVRATVAAGTLPAPLQPGSAVRIMTGAPLPQWADTVIMREDSNEDSVARPEGPPDFPTVRFRSAPSRGQHVRRAGEDIVQGAAVLEPGVRLGPGEIGLCAALGRTILPVHRRPRVAIVSTGDELVEADRTPGLGQIAGSNAWALAAQVREAGALPTVLPIARDDQAAIESALAEALRADVVISSGGVSVGEFDFVKDAMTALGIEQEFWKVAMKPGKPIVFGTYHGRPVFGLPGNPASSMVSFELFVRPALLRLQGAAREGVLRPCAPVILDESIVNEGARRHYLRASVRRDGALLRAVRLASQGSGSLRSMVGVNALLDVPAGVGRIEAGSSVMAILLAPI